jgi:hypothetical protein
VTDSRRSYHGVIDDTIDSDGDGLTNAQEYFAGTSPIDPTSLFTISGIAPQNSGGFVISWPSAAAITYRVQWKNALTDPAWNSVTRDFTETGSLMNWTDDGSQTAGLPLQRFYRVVIP